jgi:ABC-type multidrug transport system fused ATPase/permease subunit
MELISIALLSTFFSELLKDDKSLNNENIFNFSGLNLQVSKFQFAWLILIFVLSKSLISITLIRINLNRFQKIASRISKSLLDFTLNRELQFITKKSPQEMTFIINNGITAMYIDIMGNLVVLLTEILLLGLIIIWLCTLNMVFTMAIIGYFALIFFMIQIRSAKQVVEISKVRASTDIEILKRITETLLLIREMKVSKSISRQKQSINESIERNIAKSLQNALINIIPKFIFDSALVIGLFLLVTLSFSSGQSLKSSYFILLSISIAKIVPSFMKIQNAITSIRQSFGVALYSAKFISDNETLLMDSSLIVDTNVDPMTDIKHSAGQISISFEDLEFRYEDSRDNVFTDINFKIEGPGLFAVVGESGVGKSTLADLILELNKPTSGKLTKKSSKQNQNAQPLMEYLSQTAPIYNGTIRENLSWHCSGKKLNDNDLYSVLSQVGLLEFVKSNPKGLDLDLGINGNVISGGEKQRLCLARILLSEPEILLLDEPTSALDVKNSQLVFEILRSMRNSCTIIVVTHSMGSLNFFDKIIFLTDSEIEVGTHEELHRNFENFAKFCKCQA